MLVKDFVNILGNDRGYMPIVDGSGRYATLTKKDKLISEFGEYELISATVDYDTNCFILQISKRHPCPSYKVTKVKRTLSDYDRGVYFGRYGINREFLDEKWAYCTATKECHLCYCDGDKKKCELCTK